MSDRCAGGVHPYLQVLPPAEPGVTLHQFTLATDCLHPAIAAPCQW